MNMNEMLNMIRDDLIQLQEEGILNKEEIKNYFDQLDVEWNLDIQKI